MNDRSRRTFIRNSAVAGLGLGLGGPTILTSARTHRNTRKGTLAFRPEFVQDGGGPHLADFAYASDTKWDAFHSDINVGRRGVTISDTGGSERFGINVRWFVEGMGYIFITADNEGRYYELPEEGETQSLSLNFELAAGRVARNRRRLRKLTAGGWQPDREVRALVDISEGYREDAGRATDGRRKGALSQTALLYALRASEKMELKHARHAIRMRGFREDFFLGCDARAFYQMKKPSVFMDLFTDVFNYATITYVWEHRGVIGDFERAEGDYNYEFRDIIFEQLKAEDVTIEGRPLFWFHTWVTPEWIVEKSYGELLSYVEKHTREVVGHYGDGMYAWEVVNEFHDWANMAGLTPEQTVELTKLACDVAKDTAPNVHRLINHCCPFAEYVAMGRWTGRPAQYPQRTPWEFTKDLHEAGVEFDRIGQQMYFPGRDLQDIIMLVERFEQFGRPVQLSEVGAPGGPTERAVKLGESDIPVGEHYDWHRHWDEDLQADWLEAIYTLAYSKPWIEAANWFDFVDPFSYIENGGLIRSPEGEPKAAYHRLKEMQEQWRKL